MNRKSNTVPAIVLGAGVLALIIALILAFVPFSKTGDGHPTAAFRAQQSLDAVSFKFGANAGASYTGKLTYKATNRSGQVTSTDLEFDKLTVTAAKNTEGTVRMAGNQTQYRQIGNYAWVNGPRAFWENLLKGRSITSLDLGPVDNDWASLDYAPFPDLGFVLAPRLLAGRLSNSESETPPTLGVQLTGSNKDTPDARFWPTSDPTITQVAENKVRVGDLETTYDPKTKAISHIKGEVRIDSRTTATLDTDVSTLDTDAVAKVFANETSLIPEIASAPAPGVQMVTPLVSTQQTGPCTTSGCGYDFTLFGRPNVAATSVLTGHVNYGLNVGFSVNGRPVGEIGGNCNSVVSVPFGGTGKSRCVATNLGTQGGSIRAVPSIKYLPFSDRTETFLKTLIGDNEKAAKLKVNMVRTGAKKEAAAKYNAQITGLPSSYGIKVGDYIFDGVAPTGRLHIVLSPGYAEHVTSAGVFDPSWPGTALLKQQAQRQVKAAGDITVIWFVAESPTTTAVRNLMSELGFSDKVVVYNTPPDD